MYNLFSMPQPSIIFFLLCSRLKYAMFVVFKVLKIIERDSKEIFYRPLHITYRNIPQDPEVLLTVLF